MKGIVLAGEAREAFRLQRRCVLRDLTLKEI